MSVPTIKCGVLTDNIPMLGLGTYLSKPGEVQTAINLAIELGYRHFDCAYMYGNEKEIGGALRDNIDNKSVTRDELFVVSKLWHTFHRKEDVSPVFKKQLDDFGLAYLDLYLVHWPFSLDPTSGELMPKTASGGARFDPRDPSLLETWSAMEGLVMEGKVKNIGVSNYNIAQLKEILANCRIRPACMQAESHPLCPNTELIEFCKSEGIVFVAYRPLVRQLVAPAAPEDGSLYDKGHALCTELAAKYHVTPAQILLRYHLDRGVCVIPKSTNPARLKENIDVTKFNIDQEDLKRLNNIGGGKIVRLCKVPDYKDHRYYPFKDEL